MTNREWLESLSDEELAANLVHLNRCSKHIDCESCMLGVINCIRPKDVADWLKAERSESK